MSDLTAKRLREVLHYDHATGHFDWLVTNSQRRGRGERAGSLHKVLGYVFIGVDGKKHLAHRLAWLYMTGEWPSQRLDHRDGNRSNNVWRNLREATGSQNISNARLHKDNRAKLKGVSFCAATKRWRATIRSNGVTHRLGRFPTPEAAHAAYCEAAERLNGVFARMH